MFDFPLGPQVGAAVGPRPNLGNGYMATQVGSSSFYIAGVFTGDLPPPFGKSKGAVSGPVNVCVTSLRNHTDQWVGGV